MSRPIVLSKRALWLLAWTLVGILLGVLISSLLDSAYELLFKWFPDTFPIYSAVLERESYERHTALMRMISLSLTLLLSVYLSLRFDNFRCEYVISETDGLFLVRNEYLAYTKRFVIDDLITSAFVGAFITLPFIFIPVRFLEMNNIFSSLLRLLHSANTLLGFPIFIITVSSILFASHLAASLSAMRVWRAKWLTGFSEVR